MGTPDAFSRLCGILENHYSGEAGGSSGDKGSERSVLIQTHDFPDHDAVAAAFGLARLLGRRGFFPQMLHRGRIRSHSLSAMIAELGIPLRRIHAELSGKERSLPCIIVDGSPRNANAVQVTDLLLGVVDHHPNPGYLDCPFSDIRTSYGSCSTIVADYWAEAELFPDRNTATALLMGIQMDTDFLSRRVSPPDLDAHHRLFFRADWQFGTRMVKASLCIQDLPAFGAAAANSRTHGPLFMTVLPYDCSQELISIMADFFLRLREISITVIVESGGDKHYLSVRSRGSDISAAAVVRTALSGIGEGGGHDHMAGGFIHPESQVDAQTLFERFIDAVETAQENQ